jgi:Rps23 Pro-64 3,4-dihydroxylase Tpa1-like proline 4-hydroxylase
MYLLRSNEIAYPIYWTDNFLSDGEIETIIKYTETLPEHNAAIGNKIAEKEKKEFTLDYHIKDMNVGVVPRKRITNIKWIALNDETNWLYKKIIKEINRVNQENFDLILKFVENLQFSEYHEDHQGFYSKHDDCGLKESLETFVDIRKLSFSIQLTDEKNYEGGELIFHLRNGKEKVAPKSKGTIVFFNSDIEHEVKPVKKGVRHALVSWVNGPNLR